MTWSVFSTVLTKNHGADLVWKCCFTGVRIPIVEIRWSYGFLFSVIGFLILVNQHFDIESRALNTNHYIPQTDGDGVSGCIYVNWCISCLHNVCYLQTNHRWLRWIHNSPADGIPEKWRKKCQQSIKCGDIGYRKQKLDVCFHGMKFTTSFQVVIVLGNTISVVWNTTYVIHAM